MLFVKATEADLWWLTSSTSPSIRWLPQIPIKARLGGAKGDVQMPIRLSYQSYTRQFRDSTNAAGHIEVAAIQQWL